MQLNFLADLEFRYGDPIDMLFLYDGSEGRGFGGGDGTVSGDRISGTFKWSNLPRIRPDGAVEPNVTGVIRTGDGARILFHIGGYSLMNTDQKSRTVIGGVTLLSDDERYKWINTTYAIQEGAIQLETGVVRARVYECVAEPLS